MAGQFPSSLIVTVFFAPSFNVYTLLTVLQMRPAFTLVFIRIVDDTAFLGR